MIVIVDYGMGNLRSVQKGFERAGHAATISGDPRVVATADRVVLPGVGAFADAIAELHRRGLVEPLLASIASGRPFLGICLGLQLLFDVSLEGGEWRGLGVLPGKVERFALSREYKVPHMGWNQVYRRRPAPILEGIADGAHFYFVHSYYVVPADRTLVAAEVEYHEPFCAMVWRDNLYATQFHPEKSQANGLRMLENFGRLK
ncbi:MAG: imidazole glycerol phosphate synthase subunit HisH [Planctomycetes bacterium]|nr:imidazole glycerol phosphate synthase subunit HisH [Planctomycetota bacterium]